MTPEHEQIFNNIYNSYYKKIYAFCVIRLDGNTEEANEIAEEAFFTLSVKWDSLNSHSEAALASWVYSAAKNLIHNHRRSVWRNNSRYVSLEEYIEYGKDVADNTSPFDQITYETYINKIREELSAEEWKLFNYVVIEEYSILEISLILDMKFNAVKTRWHRLRKKLQKILKNYIK